MNTQLTNTLEVMAEYTNEKPSADAILIATQLSAIADAVQRHNELLDYLVDAANESNQMNERRLNRGQ